MIKRILLLIFFSQVAFAQLDTLWTKTYFPDEDTLGFIGISLQPTLDGGFVVLGEQTSENIEPEIFLLKADSDGETLWTKLLPNSNYEYVKAFSISETQNGGLYVLTRESNFNCQDEPDSSSNAFLVITSMNSYGDTLWTRALVNNYLANQYELCSLGYTGHILHDGNYLIFGKYFADGERKTWLLKTDSEGNIIWENSYDLSTTTDITEGGDGNIYISGGYGMWGTPATAYIVKINQNGTQEWIQNESSSLNTSGNNIYPIVDNGLAVAGAYTSTDPDWNATGRWLWTTDSLGNTEWAVILDDVGIYNYGDLVQHEDGTFIIIGGAYYGELSYALINMDEGLSHNITFNGYYIEPHDIKALNYNTQIALINYSDNYYPHIGIIKSIYNSSYCVADDGTDGVELWSGCYSIQNTTALDLSFIGVTGDIPPEIGNLINLSSLILKENQLAGEIPPEISYLINLTQLDLGGNQLDGEIPPEIGYLTNLNILDLGGNQFTGAIPPEIGNLPNLNQLELGGNQLTGAIPPEIGNLSSLTFIHLEYNQFTGEIPPEIGNLTNLVWLNFVHNQLTGVIPSTICNLDMNWSDPNNFNINENQLCPPYPDCVTDYVGEQDTTNCEQVSIIDETLPITYNLHNAYPNPFNPITTLRYDLAVQTHVNITVYNMLGRKVRTILNQQQDPGYKSLIWDATNDYGKPVSAGIYLYQIQAGEYISTKKMVLLK